LKPEGDRTIYEGSLLQLLSWLQEW